MFIVLLLRFTDRKERASALMEAHREWIGRGFDEGVFLLAGSLRPADGGTLLAHGISLSDLQARVEEDPFVRERIVSAEILDVAPSRVDPLLGILAG